MLGGCSDDPTLTLSRWELAIDASATTTAVTLPAQLPLTTADGSRPESYRLRQRVELPPAWRGKRLTLAFVKLAAPARLRVNGVEAAAIAKDRWADYREAFPQRWTITAQQSTSGSLALDLTLKNTWAQSGWLDVPARLSPTPAGAARLLRIFEWNRITSVMGLAATTISALIYLFIFAWNRKKRDTGWYVLEAICGGLYPALNLNLLQPLVGSWDVPLAALGVSTAGLAGVHMMHCLLKLPRPHWIWLAAWLVHVVLALVFHDPFRATFFVAATGGLMLGAAACYQIYRYGVAALRQRQPGALALSVGWLAMLLLGGVDILGWMGLGAVFGGWQGAGAGIFTIALAQSLNLSRDHIRALKEADSLTEELSKRIAALEASNREIKGLNQELRHQVGVRSHDLAQNLANASSAPLPDDSMISVGDVISERYRIDSVLGSGGMGVVYKALRLTDQRRCALKVIKHRPSTEDLARLSREAMVLSQIEHPNIIEVLDINVSNSGKLYIVMEFGDGEQLGKMSERFGEAGWALPVLAQTADALQAIHAEEVIHRDLKPGNILHAYKDDGSPWVKVVDFGLAGLIDANESAVLQLATTLNVFSDTKPPKGVSLTQTGAIIGTPLYMAPELVSGSKEVGPPADIFAFGVVAYEILGKMRPFAEVPLVSVVRGHPVEPQEHLSQLCADLRPDVAEMVMQCLSVDPHERPPAKKIVALLQQPT